MSGTDIHGRKIFGETGASTVDEAYLKGAGVIKADLIRQDTVQLRDKAVTQNTLNFTEDRGVRLEVAALEAIKKIQMSDEDDTLSVGKTGSLEIATDGGADKVVIKEAAGTLRIYTGADGDEVKIGKANHVEIKTDHMLDVMGSNDDVRLDDANTYGILTRAGDDTVTLGASSTQDFDAGTAERMREVHMGTGDDTLIIERNAVDFYDRATNTLRIRQVNGDYVLTDNKGNSITISGVDTIRFNKDPQGWKNEFKLQGGKYVRQATHLGENYWTSDNIPVSLQHLRYDPSASLPPVIDGQGAASWASNNVTLPIAAGEYQAGIQSGVLRQSGNRDQRILKMDADATGFERSVILRGIDQIEFKPADQLKKVERPATYDVSAEQPILKDIIR